MKKFVQFTEDLIRNRYSILLQKIAQEKTPCAFFTPFIVPEARNKILTQIQKVLGINLKYLIAYEENDSVNAPADIEVVPLKNLSQVFPKPKFVLIFQFDYAQFICGYLEFFEKLGIETLIIDESVANAEKYFNEISSHLTDLFDVYEMLDDDSSRETMLGYLLARVSRKMNYLKMDNAPQYFTTGFMPKSGDVLIDAGAFDGVSASLFTEHGCKVYAFEMDSRNFAMCKQVASEKNFVVENFGLGSYRHAVHYHPDSAGSFVEETRGGGAVNSPTAQIVSLDEYVAEKNLPSVDFIKMDIEGSELDALKGATQTLLRFKPRLAISAYHKPDDLWILTKFIKSIRPDYEFVIRQYPIDIVSGKKVMPQWLINFYEFGNIYPHAISCCECVIHAR